MVSDDQLRGFAARFSEWASYGIISAGNAGRHALIGEEFYMEMCQIQSGRPCLRGAAVLAGASLTVLFFAACGSPTRSNQPPPPASVFFLEPRNGATVKSPVHFVFGADQIAIMPVPEGTVEQPRPRVGHFHLGVEQDCLPAGQEIERGTPNWVHFGKAERTFDLQLPPGPHKFALQIGDDQHRTIEGLCATISITVAE